MKLRDLYRHISACKYARNTSLRMSLASIQGGPQHHRGKMNPMTAAAAATTTTTTTTTMAIESSPIAGGNSGEDLSLGCREMARTSRNRAISFWLLLFHHHHHHHHHHHLVVVDVAVVDVVVCPPEGSRRRKRRRRRGGGGVN